MAGCGGGNDHAKVEASLQHYMGNLTPEYAPFPVGAGIPRVKDNGCRDRRIKFEGPEFPVRGRSGKVKKGESFALWSCVIRFGTLAMPVLVAVDDSTEVVFATPAPFWVVGGGITVYQLDANGKIPHQSVGGSR